jgi:ECF sigma factor
LHAAETRQIGSLRPENSLHGRPNDAAILVDDARKRAAAKRGGNAFTRLDGASASAKAKDLDLLALHDAMKRLASVDPRQCQIGELPFFGSLSIEETAEVCRFRPQPQDANGRPRVTGCTTPLAAVPSCDS